MNPDYIIGSKQPHILFADYAADSGSASTSNSASNLKATPISGSKVDAAKDSRNDDGEELTFDDFVDIINPLQHIPVVNYIYRAITGDKISGFAEVAGGGLYGGPIGLIGGVVSAAFNDETGHSPGETMVADLFGIEDHATMVASADRTPKAPADLQNATLDQQIASAMPANQTLNAQLASAMPKANQTLDTQIASAMPKEQTLDNQIAMAMPRQQTLDNQIASASLPPVTPKSKMPFGGMMDMAMVNKARSNAPSINDAPASSDMQVAANEAAGANAATPIASIGHPQEVADDQKFYSLGKVRRVSPGMTPQMPVYGGPDVRLKPISRMAINNKIGGVAASASTNVAIPDQESEARKILGLPDASKPVAELASENASAALNPAQADLAPNFGKNSSPVPSALIEDMMKMGLDKYQKGLSNGSLGSQQPSIDVRG